MMMIVIMMTMMMMIVVELTVLLMIRFLKPLKLSLTQATDKIQSIIATLKLANAAGISSLKLFA
jgi:hypothetical protein